MQWIEQCLRLKGDVINLYAPVDAEIFEHYLTYFKSLKIAKNESVQIAPKIKSNYEYLTPMIERFKDHNWFKIDFF